MELRRRLEHSIEAAHVGVIHQVEVTLRGVHQGGDVGLLGHGENSSCIVSGRQDMPDHAEVSPCEGHCFQANFFAELLTFSFILDDHSK
jgi:hypothetical protein